MSELKGAIFSILILVAFILPVLLFIGIQSIHQNGFLKTATEVEQMIEREGGVTPRVQQVADFLGQKGYTISFSDTSGKPVMGKQSIGTIIRIQYQYAFENVFRPQLLTTTNYVTVMRR
ncbi:hypothetical protein ABNF65_06540 [Paenibacillus larvae]